MTLERQSANVILYQGIDTKTNQKLVEGKLLEMTNCEILNQQIVKSPGSISLSELQTSASDPRDQKALTTINNNLIVADNNIAYKYNPNENILNAVENMIFAEISELPISQNTVDFFKSNTDTFAIAQLYSPFTTTLDGICAPEPISAQYGIYLFTIVYRIIASAAVGVYDIRLTRTDSKSVIFELNGFAPLNEIAQDAIGTPTGIYFYTVNKVNGQINEYYLSYDLSLINVPIPFSSNIFPFNPVLVISRTSITDMTNYCSFLSIEYSDGFIFFAFRSGIITSYNGMMAKRNLNGGNAIDPTIVTTGFSITTGNQSSKNMCTSIFYHPDTNTNYFIILFNLQYSIFSCVDVVYTVRNYFNTSYIINLSSFSIHSIGFLSKTNTLVSLVHDLTEQQAILTSINTIAPTVVRYTLNQIVGGGTTLVNSPIDLIVQSDSRRPNVYGNSAIAGKVLCYYDKILIPILYYAFVFIAGNTPIYTPGKDRRCSAHLVQWIDEVVFYGPTYGLRAVLQHITWIKEFSCSLYGASFVAEQSVIPSILKSKMPLAETNQYFVGFFVKTKIVSKSGSVTFSHQIKSYNLSIPTIFNFESYVRGAGYFGSGKMNELTVSTLSEMGFFEFPQISVGLPDPHPPAPPPNPPNILAGTYLYSVYYEWTNGNGDIVRSDTQEILFKLDYDVVSIPLYITPPPFFSNKYSQNIIKLYRSTKNGNIPFFDINFKPDVNNLPILTDNSMDQSINNNEIVYTNKGILGDYPFYAIKSFTLYRNSIVVIDSNNRNLLRYAKPQLQGIALSSNEAFSQYVDTRGGDCNFLAPLDEKLIIFKDDNIFVTEGDTPDNSGNNSTLSTPTFVTSPVGCSEVNSVVQFPGGIIFKSKKGIWQLDRSLSSTYIGADVEAYNDLTITSSKLLTAVNKIKYSTLEGTILCYDYYYKAWNIEQYEEGIYDLSIVDDKVTLITTTGKILQENNQIYTRDLSNYNMSFTTGWIKLAGLTGFQRLYKIIFLGSYKGSHMIKASIYYDYNDDPLQYIYFNPTQNLGIFNYFGKSGSDFTWGQIQPYGGYKDSTYIFRMNVRQQKCMAVKIRLEDVFIGQIDQNGSSFTATDLNFDIGMKSNTVKVPSRLQQG